MTDEEIVITRIIEEKEEEDDAKDLIEFRVIEEMVPR